MQATVYGAACSKRAKLERRFKDKEVILTWEDADLTTLGIARFGIGEGALEKPDVPIRLYNCWTEDWEEEAIANHDLESQALLLRKYGGICLTEGQDVFTIHSKKLNWRKKRGCSRYEVIACLDIYETEEENDTPEEVNLKANTYETFDIDDDLHGLIYEHYRKNPDPKVRCVPPEQEGAIDEHGEWNNWIPEAPKKPVAGRKKP
jgi:hypothetical protein